MKFIKIVITTICMMFNANLSSQEIRTSKGRILYVIPDNMTITQAEINAVEQAKLKVIADNFGTIVESISSFMISNTNGESSTDSFTLGETEVRGEWIETVDGPVIERKVVNEEFVLEVSISGRIREIKHAPVQFHSKVLRNGITDNCESDTFKEKDKMYMSFQTPEDGYVSIYITDGKTVQCLFPYNGLSSEYMKVEADRHYVFFSKKASGDLDPARVMECPLGCKTDIEYDRVILIFSPNKYSKAVDHSSQEANLPRILTFDEFQKWLSRLKRFDVEMTYKSFDIIISK